MYEFYKMHGLGNHFVFFDEMSLDYGPVKKPGIMRVLCDVKIGIGADGVIFIMNPTDSARQCRMQMFNVDGTEAEMCGNAIRGVAHLFKKYHRGGDPVLIETKSGVREIRSADEKDGIRFYTVDMGKASFSLVDTGELAKQEEQKPLEWREEILDPVYVNVGNPHAVLFLKTPLEDDDMASLGAWMETHPNHPRRINVEFVEILSEHEIKVHVWERGCGMTSACGTGATGCAAAGIKTGRLNSPVTVHMPGGDLRISMSDSGNLHMTGPVEEVAEGRLSPAFIDRLFRL